MAAQPKLKLSANLSFLFKEVDFLERFAEASNSGFNAVECGVDIYKFSKDELISAKDKAQISVVHINAPTGNPQSFGLTSVPGKEQEFKETVAVAIDYANALQCKNIHFLAGTYPEDEETETVVSIWRETYISNLIYAAKECQKFGIVALIEPISVIPKYFLQHQNEACEVIKVINMPNLKLQFDIYHAQRMDGNITEFLRAWVDIIGHIQIAQVPGRHEPLSPGELDYNFIFQVIRDIKYANWIGCEYVPNGTTNSGLGWMKEAIDAEH